MPLLARFLRNLEKYTDEEHMMLALAYKSEEKYDEALEHLYVIKNTEPNYKAATELKLEIEEGDKDPAALE